MIEEPQTTEVDVIPPTALEAITRGEVDIQIATARRYPRSLALFRKRALEMATIDEETAASCFYVLPRDGKTIEGPGIRLAEIVASAYGNLRIAARVTDIDDKFITAQGVVHDLETNVAYATEVKRRITGKGGRRYSDDMIVVTSNAACSIATRNAIFKAVPKSFIDPIYREAKKVAVGDVRTLQSNRERILDRFMKMGVTPDRILAKLGRNGVEEIGLGDLEILVGLGTAIRDETTSIEEAFPIQMKVAKPSFLTPSQAPPTTGDDAANGLTETKAGEINPTDTIERVGAEMYGDAWPAERARLCTEVSTGASSTLSELTPVELTGVMDILTKEVETRTAAQTKKEAK